MAGANPPEIGNLYLHTDGILYQIVSSGAVYHPNAGGAVDLTTFPAAGSKVRLLAAQMNMRERSTDMDIFSKSIPGTPLASFSTGNGNTGNPTFLPYAHAGWGDGQDSDPLQIDKSTFAGNENGDVVVQILYVVIPV